MAAPASTTLGPVLSAGCALSHGVSTSSPRLGRAGGGCPVLLRRETAMKPPARLLPLVSSTPTTSGLTDPSVTVDWAASPEDVDRGSALRSGDRRSRVSRLAYLWIGFVIGYLRSFDIRIITMMGSGWEKTARRPRRTRRWWAPPGTQDEENQPL